MPERIDYRQILEQKRELLAGEVRAARSLMQNLRDSSGELSTADNHPADVASDTFGRGRDLGELRRVTAGLGAVKDALDRLDRGEFGVCEQCGQPISDERLEVIPETRFCKDCAHDARERFRRSPEEDVIATQVGRLERSEQGETASRLLNELENWGTSSGPQDRGSDDQGC